MCIFYPHWFSFKTTAGCNTEGVLISPHSNVPSLLHLWQHCLLWYWGHLQQGRASERRRHVSLCAIAALYTRETGPEDQLLLLATSVQTALCFHLRSLKFQVSTVWFVFCRNHLYNWKCSNISPDNCCRGHLILCKFPHSSTTTLYQTNTRLTSIYLWLVWTIISWTHLDR